MIYLLYGADTYQLKEKLREVVGHQKKTQKTGTDLRFLDLALGAEIFFQEINQTSLFGEKRIFILKEAFGAEDLEKKLLEKKSDLLRNLNTIIFYEESSIKKSDILFKFLVKNAEVIEVEEMEGEDLRKWLAAEFLKYGTKTEKGVSERLISFVGDDLWQLSNEIKKLAAFKKDGKVELADIDTLVKPKIETDIFRTIDAIAGRNKEIALDLVHKHLEKGESAIYLLSMINYQFRNILEIKDLMEKNKPYQAILEQSSLHPYVIKKSYVQAQKFSFQELKKIYQKIFQIDLSVKTGKIDQGISLDLLIGEI